MSEPRENGPRPPDARRAGTVFVNPTRVEGGRSDSLAYVLNALRCVPGLEVVESPSAPPQCIAIGGEVVAFVDDLDPWQSASPDHGGEMVEAIRRAHARIVFKYQYRSGINYLPGTIGAGFFCRNDARCQPRDLLRRARPVDVSARMRTGGYAWQARLAVEDSATLRAGGSGTPEPTCDWLMARGTIVREAEQLGREGWRTRTGMIDCDDYYDELLDTNIGFHWRGCGKLTYRMIEYIRAGVVMITDPQGPTWPIRQDVILEDGVHCIFCDDPARFAEVARSLLLDPPRVAAIRRNVVELWESKLCPAAMGAWYWRKLEECCDGRHP